MGLSAALGPRRPARPLPGAPPVPAQEMIGEERHVPPALAQGRQRQVEHLEAEVEVLAEAPLLHHLPQVAMGGGDDPHVHLLRAVGAEALDLAELEEAQQLGLRLDGDLADLVEEQGAAVGRGEAAGAVASWRR